MSFHKGTRVHDLTTVGRRECDLQQDTDSPIQYNVVSQLSYQIITNAK